MGLAVSRAYSKNPRIDSLSCCTEMRLSDSSSVQCRPKKVGVRLYSWDAGKRDLLIFHELGMRPDRWACV